MFTSYEITRAVLDDRHQQAQGDARRHRLTRTGRRARRNREKTPETGSSFRLYQFPEPIERGGGEERAAS
jgi:hypothetical protein